ncbi:MAG: biotin/lipoyl-binding protein [Oscillospiraceae bacterium]|jgi:glutaconyl-CoA decarboxylase|nr:biotin/lipoyl-binding protein [Oscillospiraceae bacterium]
MRTFRITVQGIAYDVEVEEVQAGAPAAPIATAPAPVAAPAMAAPPAAPAPASSPVQVIAGGETIKAPMPGTILSVNAQAGDTIKKGDVLCILEAMKMENEIMSPVDGTVAQVMTAKGASVNPGDSLFVIA